MRRFRLVPGICWKPGKEERKRAIVPQVLAFLWILLTCSFFSVTDAEQQPDLYQLLGVTRNASAKEIKQAYRRAARNTHPDKNTNVPPDQAAEAFRQVVHAFEVLSDDTTRRRYDRTGRTDGASTGRDGSHDDSSSGFGGGRQNHGFQWNWNVKFKPRRLKDQFNVQQAQSRVLHVLSLAQLQTIMLDENDVLERNLLICFTTKATETHADDEMVFPYPFAHMSLQGIWWEDLLQTVRISFHKSSELSRFFHVTAEEADQAPVFIIARRGTPMTAEAALSMQRIRTRDREEFESWVWNNIQVEIEIVNHHNHEVECFWIHGGRGVLKAKVKSGDTAYLTTRLSHEWYVRDSRVDTFPSSPGRYKLSETSSLGSWKIVSDKSPQIFVIEADQCVDGSGHCPFWATVDRACETNPRFMAEQCRKTCNLCDSSTANDEL